MKKLVWSAFIVAGLSIPVFLATSPTLPSETTDNIPQISPTTEPLVLSEETTPTPEPTPTVAVRKIVATKPTQPTIQLVTCSLGGVNYQLLPEDCVAQTKRWAELEASRQYAQQPYNVKGSFPEAPSFSSTTNYQAADIQDPNYQATINSLRDANPPPSTPTPQCMPIQYGYELCK